MNSSKFNTIAGWTLGTALLVFGLNSLADVIYHAEAPEKPGYLIEVAEAETGGEATGGEEQPAVSLGTLMASADAAKGQAGFKACAACHTADKGGPNKVGPNLWGIVNRMHASHEGFNYSEAMAAKKAEPWTYEALNEFIHNPKAAVPGTKMAYGGLKRDQERANLLAYLGSLADTPVPPPAP